MTQEEDHFLAIAKGGKLTNLGAIMAAEAASTKSKDTCMEHSGMCQKIIAVEEKVTSIEKKQDRFFWTLLTSVCGVALLLLMAVWNMSLNAKMLAAIDTILKFEKMAPK